jgi:hypothetical protein
MFLKINRSDIFKSPDDILGQDTIKADCFFIITDFKKWRDIGDNVLLFLKDNNIKYVLNGTILTVSDDDMLLFVLNFKDCIEC